MHQIAAASKDAVKTQMQKQLQQREADWVELKAEAGKTCQYRRDDNSRQFTLQDELANLQEEEKKRTHPVYGIPLPSWMKMKLRG